MPTAVATTLAHRLPMLFGALNDPHAWRDPEFSRMVSEKMKVGLQGSRTLGDMAVAGQQALTAYAGAQAMANMVLGLALATSAPGQWPGHLANHGRRSIDRASALNAKIGEIGSESASGGLRPAHRSVVANARRLSGRKAKVAKKR